MITIIVIILVYRNFCDTVFMVKSIYLVVVDVVVKTAPILNYDAGKY